MLYLTSRSLLAGRGWIQAVGDGFKRLDNRCQRRIAALGVRLGNCVGDLTVYGVGIAMEISLYFAFQMSAIIDVAQETMDPEVLGRKSRVLPPLPALGQSRKVFLFLL